MRPTSKNAPSSQAPQATRPAAVFPPYSESPEANELAIRHPVPLPRTEGPPQSLEGWTIDPLLALGPPEKWSECSLLNPLAPFLKPSVDPDRLYVRFELNSRDQQIITHVSRTPDNGLRTAGASSAWNLAIAQELQKCMPLGTPDVRAFNASAVGYAMELGANHMNEKGSLVTLSDFYGICKQASQRQGQSAEMLDQAALELRYGGTPGDKKTRISAVMAHLIAGLRSDRAAGSGVEPSHFSESDLKVVLDRFVFDRTEIHARDVAQMFRAIRRDPGLSECVLEHANAFLEHMSLGDRHDELMGSQLIATALVLSLPPETLEQLLFTREEVAGFKRCALQLLGHLAFGELPLGDSIVRLLAVGRDLDRVGAHVDSLARDFNADHRDDPIAARFIFALKILEHNADRMETVAGMAPQENWRDRPLLELLDEAAPPRFAEIEADFLRQLKGPVRAALLGYIPEEAAPAATSSVPQGSTPARETHAQPRATRQARPQAAPIQKTKVKTRGEPAVQPPQVEPVASDTKTSSPPGAPSYAETRQPGSRPHGDREHFHPRDHRALPKAEVKARREKLKAYQKLGKLFRFTEWTPELGDVVRASWQAHNAREATR